MITQGRGKTGLTRAEAKRRLAAGGGNEIVRRQQNFGAVKLLLRQFKSPLIYILVAAGAVTGYLKEYLDSAVIWLAVAVNTGLGFWQEFRAARAIEALGRFLKPSAKVIRGGVREKIPLREVVVGDLCVLEAGQSVPADGVVVEAADLTINEALLTGESLPVAKSAAAAARQAYMGTIVETGWGLMRVVKVGMATEMGKIAKGVTGVREEVTPLQKRLAEFSRTIALAVFGVGCLIVVIGLVKQQAAGVMLKTAVAVAVAAIPEGLVVALTVILALGMQRILRRKALVRTLVAAETLGGVSVICADKTGTLTEGRTRVVAASGEKTGLLKAAVWCNDQRDPLEAAMLTWAREELGEQFIKLLPPPARTGHLPFSPTRKYLAIRNREGIFMCGAPEVVISKCRLTEKQQQEWREQMAQAGAKGLRLIGLADKAQTENRRQRENKLTEADLAEMEWLGVLVFEDPVRPKVEAALKEARAAGIEVKVITGDFRETAVAVMEKLQVYPGKLKSEEIMNGEELAACTASQLRQRVRQVKLFVRTMPDQKVRIVDALQAQGEVVAMTGDGVNDAPALKKADIGIVVSEASDVAKETADMVLLDSNFRTIVAAVREGRTIYETIRKVIVYLLADGFTELILVVGSLLLGVPLPVTALQILWVNLIEDGLPNLALAFEKTEPGVMAEKPRRRESPLLDREMKLIIFAVGIVTDLLLLGLFLWLYSRGLEVGTVRTLIFVGLGINSLLYVFSIKTMRRNLWQAELTDNPFLLVAVGIGFILLAAAVVWRPLGRILETQPLTAGEWGLMVGLGLVQVAAIEAVKLAFNKRNR